MERTTVCLPADLMAAGTALARHRGSSTSAVIRESLRSTVPTARPRPRGALFAGGHSVADAVDEHLAGLGRR